MRIAVVDDEAEQRELIESFLARFACEQRREIIVDTYCNGFDFLSVFDQRYDAVFLDIQMPDANGIQVAEEIRAIDQRVKIIFITNLGQYAVQGYAVRAMDFIVKPLEWESFSEKMRLFCRDLDIRLVLFVDAQCMDFMRPGDIVAIAGNALDNAVEAQMRLPEQVAREIMVRIHRDEHWLYLHFENTFAGEIKWRDGLPATNKENAQGHGLGLKSIRAAIECYEGTLQIEARDGRFALNILIPREMAGSSN